MKKQLQILALMFKYLTVATFILIVAAALYYLWLIQDDLQSDYSILIQLTPTLQEDVPGE